MKWYVLVTTPGKETEAAQLLEAKVDHRLWKYLRVPKKQQLFRFQGRYVWNRKVMFPGYFFVASDVPEELKKELQKARAFPWLVGEEKTKIVAVEKKDLEFLQNVCGEYLDEDMGLSLVKIDDQGRVTEAFGALKPYLEDIVRQRLRQRYVIAKVPLFGRTEEVLFGIRLPEDEIIDRYENIIKEVKAG